MDAPAKTSSPPKSDAWLLSLPRDTILQWVGNSLHGAFYGIHRQDLLQITRTSNTIQQDKHKKMKTVMLKLGSMFCMGVQNIIWCQSSIYVCVCVFKLQSQSHIRQKCRQISLSLPGSDFPRSRRLTLCALLTADRWYTARNCYAWDANIECHHTQLVNECPQGWINGNLKGWTGQWCALHDCLHVFQRCDGWETIWPVYNIFCWASCLSGRRLYSHSVALGPLHVMKLNWNALLILLLSNWSHSAYCPCTVGSVATCSIAHACGMHCRSCMAFWVCKAGVACLSLEGPTSVTNPSASCALNTALS